MKLEKAISSLDDLTEEQCIKIRALALTNPNDMLCPCCNFKMHKIPEFWRQCLKCMHKTITAYKWICPLCNIQISGYDGDIRKLEI